LSNDIYKSIIDGGPYGYACYKLDRVENGSYNFELVEINKAFSDLTGIRPHLPANNDTANIFPFDLGAEKDRLRLIGDIALNGGSCEFRKYFPEQKKELKVKVLSVKDRCAVLVIYDCLPEESVIPADHIISLAAEKFVFWIADMNFKCKYISSSVENLLGYSAEEIYGLPSEKIMSDRSLKKACATVSLEL
jgi:PAS domain-containing protein